MTTPSSDHPPGWRRVSSFEEIYALSLADFAEEQGLEVGTAPCDDGSEIKPVRTEDREELCCSTCGHPVCVGRNRTQAFWTHMGEEVHVPPGVWETLEVVHW